MAAESVRQVCRDILNGGQGHDGLVNCVRTGMSKGVSISKTFVAANAIYSNTSVWVSAC